MRSSRSSESGAASSPRRSTRTRVPSVRAREMEAGPVRMVPATSQMKRSKPIQLFNKKARPQRKGGEALKNVSGTRGCVPRTSGVELEQVAPSAKDAKKDARAFKEGDLVFVRINEYGYPADDDQARMCSMWWPARVSYASACEPYDVDLFSPPTGVRNFVEDIPRATDEFEEERQIRAAFDASGAPRVSAADFLERSPAGGISVIAREVFTDVDFKRALGEMTRAAGAQPHKGSRSSPAKRSGEAPRNIDASPRKKAKVKPALEEIPKLASDAHMRRAKQPGPTASGRKEGTKGFQNGDLVFARIDQEGFAADDLDSRTWTMWWPARIISTSSGGPLDVELVSPSDNIDDFVSFENPNKTNIRAAFDAKGVPSVASEDFLELAPIGSGPRLRRRDDLADDFESAVEHLLNLR